MRRYNHSLPFFFEHFTGSFFITLETHFFSQMNINKVKTLAGEEMVDEERELVKRELDLLGKLNSPYVVTYMGSTIVPGQPLCLVMEFVKVP